MNLNAWIKKLKKGSSRGGGKFSFSESLLILAIILPVTLLGFSTWEQVQTKGEIQAIKTQVDLLKSQLTQNQGILKALIDGNAELATSLQREQQSRLEVETEAEVARQKLLALETDVNAQRQTLESADITKLIRDWSPRVARLSCDTTLSGGGTRTARASAVVDLRSSGHRLITNKHVLESGGLTADSCEVNLIASDINFDIKKEAMELVPERDLAYLNLKSGVFLSGVVGPVKICSSQPALGDAVVILGYPSVGSKVGITATEGIIAGFDEEYLITSAKIERGNSGGAAVLVKDNCFVGLPTLTVAGRTESLARILPVL